jgi:hypothetical protein
MPFGHIRASRGLSTVELESARIETEDARLVTAPSSAHDIGHEARAVIRELVCVQASPLIGFEARNRPRDLRRDRAATRAADVRQDQHHAGASCAPGQAYR